MLRDYADRHPRARAALLSAVCFLLACIIGYLAPQGTDGMNVSTRPADQSTTNAIQTDHSIYFQSQQVAPSQTYYMSSRTYR